MNQFTLSVVLSQRLIPTSRFNGSITERLYLLVIASSLIMTLDMFLLTSYMHIPRILESTSVVLPTSLARIPPGPRSLARVSSDKMY